MIIEIDNRQSDVDLDLEELAGLFRTCLERHELWRAELSVVLVGEAEMSRLNREQMGSEGPTDVLSFPQLELHPARLGEELARELTRLPADAELALGDVVLCPAVILSQAPAGPWDSKPPAVHGSEADAASELVGRCPEPPGPESQLHLVSVHGLLHLLGHDHADLAQARAMAEAQDELLEAVFGFTLLLELEEDEDDELQEVKSQKSEGNRQEPDADEEVAVADEGARERGSEAETRRRGVGARFIAPGAGAGAGDAGPQGRGHEDEEEFDDEDEGVGARFIAPGAGDAGPQGRGDEEESGEEDEEESGVAAGRGLPEVPAGFRSGYVALIGRPNVGKSTLMNALVGEKVSITSRKPQTTRNRILGILTDERAQVLFIDTPGLHRARDAFNRRLVDAALESLADADLVCYMIEPPGMVGPEEEFVLQTLSSVEAPIFLLINKVDTVAKASLLPLIASYQQRGRFEEVFPISALDGTNLAPLLEAIVARLPEGPPFYPADQLTDQSERFLVAERIREQVLAMTRQEVPYATAVEIERWEEKPNLLRIAAQIHVERQNQKGILIGKGGSMLKRIGTAARQDLESFFGCKVYLELHVGVSERWRESESFLRSQNL